MPTTIDVEGMSCAGCEQNVEDALGTVPGVTDATADNERGTATVHGDADPDDLITAIEDAGYEAQR